MKEFSCGDIVPGCTARFRGATEDQILSEVAVHARKDHGMDALPPELAARVRSLIRPAATAG